MQRWGEERFTKDADLSILTEFGREEVYIDALLERFKARRPDMRDFALRARVVLLYSSSGVGLDVSLGAFPFEESAIRRASKVEYLDGVSLRTCSAEDLIVFKPSPTVTSIGTTCRASLSDKGWKHWIGATS